MRQATLRILIPAAILLSATSALALDIKQERVPGGVLEQTWVPGFGVPRTLQAAILSAVDPAYANPSGDHTVGVLTNISPDSGGIALACTDPVSQADYVWEGWFFTGVGDTRRGLVLRADPSNQFQSCYQFVINAGLFQILFRKLVNGAPATLASWTSNTLPAGVPQQNTWHHMKVIAYANSYRCFFDGTELTTTPIVDSSAPLLTGWVGVYNFRFDLGNVAVKFDDLKLSLEGSTAVRRVSWGSLKSRF